MEDLLFLAHRIPYPPNKGDKIRAFHILQYLQRHFRVHLGCFVDDANDLCHVQQLAADCASSCFVRLHPARARLASMTALLRHEALTLPYYRSSEMRQWVRQAMEIHQIRAVLTYSSPMAQYVSEPGVGAPLLRVMDLVDVDSEKWLAYAQNKPWPWSWLYRREGKLLLQFERQVARNFDTTLLVSAAEAALFRQRAPEAAGKIDHFNNGVDTAYFSPSVLHPSPYSETAMVFTGAMDYWPNIDAVLWFCQHVMPTLRSRFPNLQFHIVGARPAPRVRDLARQPGVHVSGTVPDVRPYLQHAALVLASLRIARGVQNKVLEAMSMQKTVLASPQALEGISAAVGLEVLQASNAPGFIEQISRQLTEPVNLGPAARQRVLRDYQWNRNLQRLGTALGVHDPLQAAAR